MDFFVLHFFIFPKNIRVLHNNVHSIPHCVSKKSTSEQAASNDGQNLPRQKVK